MNKNNPTNFVNTEEGNLTNIHRFNLLIPLSLLKRQIESMIQITGTLQ